MKRYIKDYAYLFIVAGLIIALDQWTKYLVRSNLQIGEVWDALPWLTPFARILHWHNTGVAFGMFQNAGNIFKILPIIISLAIIIIFPSVPAKDWYLRVAMILQLGGAVGNLIDRLTIGYVVDFISIGKFAVFNVADSSITIGVGVLLLGMWLQERKEKKQELVESSLDESSSPEEPVL